MNIASDILVNIEKYRGEQLEKIIMGEKLEQNRRWEFLEKKLVLETDLKKEKMRMKQAEIDIKAKELAIHEAEIEACKLELQLEIEKAKILMGSRASGMLLCLQICIT